ncbi:hypothetical protein [Fulvimarina sp. MAC8]|uniref:hypothetical protein n=1 Tax=Fulvimarina sp. MAC8 TaxID=3162874 RepID=UPI0032EE2E45
MREGNDINGLKIFEGWYCAAKPSISIGIARNVEISRGGFSLELAGSDIETFSFYSVLMPA